MDEKPLSWVGAALDDLRGFPNDARRRAGFELHQIQQGLHPTDWRPMTSVGAGVEEVRVHTGAEHRVFYIARFPEAVYVLHAFEKKTQQTSPRDIETARRRLAAVIASRSVGNEQWRSR
jgi:phage-related protein